MIILLFFIMGVCEGQLLILLASVRRTTKMHLLKRPLRRLSRHLRKMLRVYLWRSTLTHWPKL